MDMKKVGGVDVGAWYWLTDKERMYVPAQYVGPAHASLPDEGLFVLFDDPLKKQEQANIPQRVYGRILDPEQLTNIPTDLVRSDDVSEPNILWSLRRRFLMEPPEIYSSIGSILLALNPYTPIPNLYSAKKMEEYLPQSPSSSSERRES
jgi:myosin heavy subunit